MRTKGYLKQLGVVAFGLAIPFLTARAHAQTHDDARIEADVHHALDSKKYSGITLAVHGGNVILQGSVENYADKQQADNRVHHVKGVLGVDNEIRVAGPPVEDSTLRDKLAKKLAYDRVGYGTTAFNAINIGVQNGVVTLSGTVYGPVDHDSAISLVANTSGVKDVVDNLKVAPLSPMDDQLRIRLANAIYGAPELQKYAMDPAKPIRITVVNGNVTLSGVVDSKMDHDVAGIKANSVPGVFKVTNDLQVAGKQTGR
ncbi:MAG TPA: BON domain-containing protein [Acidobacteriaceae bacterium]|nr:BON domain-containing protein [Acidobacteriaceae bacterium]